MSSIRKKNFYQEKDYNNFQRFISYFYQIKFISMLKPSSILEIGVGNKTLSSYLKNNGFKVTTSDFNKQLKPDYVADATNLPFEDSSYEMVVSFQLLEHLPWKKVKEAVYEMLRVSKKYVIVSVPHLSLHFDFLFKVPLFNYLFSIPFIRLFFSLPFPLPFKSKVKDHYWELGLKNFPVKRFISLFSDKAVLIKSFRPPLNPYHHFFIFKKI